MGQLPPCCRPDFELPALPEQVATLVEAASEHVAWLTLEEMAWQVGRLYTALVGRRMRERLGIYYTPPSLARELVDMVDEAGLRWEEAHVLDPACGGAAFLVPVCQKVFRAAAHGTARPIGGQDIACRIHGMEVDRFSGWLSGVLAHRCLEIEAGTSLPRAHPRVRLGNVLKAARPESGRYDLVITNPPYERISVPARLREEFRSSLYGHANLYGMFVEASLRLCREGGYVALVAPVSFLGGQYFQRLRTLIEQEGMLAHICFIEERQGIFDGVLQEICLVLLKKGGWGPTRISHYRRVEGRQIVQELTLGRRNGRPWIIPRSVQDVGLWEVVRRCSWTIADYGYHASTGPLVWNRHRSQLRKEKGEHSYPIIWAQSVRPGGRFRFPAPRREWQFIEVLPGQEHLVRRQPVVLVQRTTAKEQPRRLLAASLDEHFIHQWGGYVAENHVNLLLPGGRPKLSPAGLAVLLNTGLIDRIFRWISGTVAVSASELMELPLPDPEVLYKEGIIGLLEEIGYSVASGQTCEWEVELDSMLEMAYRLSAHAEYPATQEVLDVPLAYLRTKAAGGSPGAGAPGADIPPGKLG